MPKRIQLRRIKGWRKPPEAIVVSRPSKWSNPWRIGQDGIPDNAAAEQRFSAAVEGSMSNGVFCPPPILNDTDSHIGTIIKDIDQLRGRDLACWCALDKPCHADVLLRLANK